VGQYHLPSYDAGVLTQEQATAQYFEDTCDILTTKSNETYKLVSNWIMTEVMRLLSEQKITIEELGLPTSYLAELVDLLADNTISSKIAKDVFARTLQEKDSPRAIVEKHNLAQVSDDSLLQSVITTIIANSPDEVRRYQEGKKNLIGYFVGQVMKETKGKANPKLVNQMLNAALNQEV
jgi:aspartyl-tRNA(Asn)/glutamyl-tRNA(Gln) amidotransferase subunit B